MNTNPMPAHGADAHNIPDPQDQEQVMFHGAVECEVRVTLVRSFDAADKAEGRDLDDATDEACNRTSSLARTYVENALHLFFSDKRKQAWSVGDVDVNSRAVKE